MKFAIQLALGIAMAPLIPVVDSVSVAQRLYDELAPQLSSGDLISQEVPPRWSSFEAPNPGAVVNVKTESDVTATVKYCTSKNIPFLAQNGGSGWATSKFGKDGVLINLASLNQVTFNTDKTQATIGGGSSIKNTIDHAYAAGALVMTGNCNCVGTLGALLGGGYGNLLGIHGFGVDTVISLRVITADGQLRTVTPSSDPDLFWALRGAGPNFGIVTSAVVKACPAKSDDDFMAWAGSLVFTPDKLEQVVQAIQDLTLGPEMVVFLYFLSGGPPTNQPVVVASPFMYKGNATTGRSAYASLYAIGPVADTTTVIPYNQWNSAGDALCVRGSRKPGWSAGFQEMIPSTWRQIWDKYVEFQQKPGAENSGVLLETYDWTKARSMDPDSAAFPHRNVNFNAFAIPWYDDPALDKDAEEFGAAVRQLWRTTSGLPQDSTYINFAHGDEPLDVVYGKGMCKLKAVKRRVDPENHFNNWFDIK
ncbi:FAD binding domain-containing protein [Xylariaceae sp. AK1471]|nr:FAD binding domain-containing protein [Xylariaceae sp. AK1471]